MILEMIPGSEKMMLRARSHREKGGGGGREGGEEGEYADHGADAHEGARRDSDVPLRLLKESVRSSALHLIDQA